MALFDNGGGISIGGKIGQMFGFGFLYPMKIYEKSTNPNLNALPCTILSINLTQDYEIPAEPVENGVLISDTQYKMPYKLNLSVFVKNENISNFEYQISKIQNANNGFIVIDQNSQKYDNLWLNSYSKQSETNDGFYFDLSMQEILKVQAFNEPVTMKKTNNAGLSSKSNQGEQLSNEKDKKTSILYDLSGKFGIIGGGK